MASPSISLVARRLLSVSGQATGLALTGGVGYGTYLYNTDRGFHRAVEAYSVLVPVVVHFRWVEFLHNHVGPLSEEEWENMDDIYAVPTVTKLGELQGMYTKYGQTAAGFTHTFGDAWIREFRKLENEVPPRPVEVVHQTIEEETGRPVDETFDSFDPEPLGSASIGQVHRATLKDGRQVAVKVQYPEAQDLFHKDIETIRTFCHIFAPEHMVVLDALEKQNAEELDYHNEARNLEEVRSNMLSHGFQPSLVTVPAPLPEFTTKRLLLMELLPGPKLVDGIRSYFSEWAKANGTTLRDIEHEARARIDREGIPAKYDGPSDFQLSLYRGWLRVQDAFVNTGLFTYNATIGGLWHWWRQSPPVQYQRSSPPPNIPRIVDVLMRVHGIQLMKYGVFNSDPHGGNFLLMEDGRVGLIDYGATKRLTRNERLCQCFLFAALYRKDEERLFQMCDLYGYKSKYGKREVLMKLLQFGYDSWGKDVTGGKNIQQFIDELKREDPWEEVPDNFVMAQFLSTRLRSLALGMNHPVKCSDWWGPMAEEILKQEGVPYEMWTTEMMLEHRPELNMQRYKFA